MPLGKAPELWGIQEKLSPANPTWEIQKCMPYEGVWVIPGMHYKGVYCTA